MFLMLSGLSVLWFFLSLMEERIMAIVLLRYTTAFVFIAGTIMLLLLSTFHVYWFLWKQDDSCVLVPFIHDGQHGSSSCYDKRWLVVGFYALSWGWCDGLHLHRVRNMKVPTTPLQYGYVMSSQYKNQVNPVWTTLPRWKLRRSSKCFWQRSTNYSDISKGKTFQLLFRRKTGSWTTGEADEETASNRLAKSTALVSIVLTGGSTATKRYRRAKE